MESSATTSVSYTHLDVYKRQGLELAFLNTENFNFDYINIYTLVKKLYDENDYSYIQDSEKYILNLQDMGYDSLKDIENIMTMLTPVSYTHLSARSQSISYGYSSSSASG